MLCALTFFAVWFLCFNAGPVSWFINNYYIRDLAERHTVVERSFSDSNDADISTNSIRTFVIILGIFCAFVAVILYSTLLLMQRLLTRIDRINSMLQIQSIGLVLLAFSLYIVTETQINFDGINASNFIKAEMPTHFHSQVLLVCLLMVLTSLLVFLTSYFETLSLFSVS